MRNKAWRILTQMDMEGMIHWWYPGRDEGEPFFNDVAPVSVIKKLTLFQAYAALQGINRTRRP